MAPEMNALRVFIDSILSEHSTSDMQQPTERDAVAAQLVEVIAEYLLTKKPEPKTY